jgi:integrase/recombinase XerD
VRKEAGFRRPPRSRRLPCLLPEETLRRFYEAVDGSGNLQHQIMLRLLLYTAVRVFELVRIAVDDLDLEGGRIFIASGKATRTVTSCFPTRSG